MRTIFGKVATSLVWFGMLGCAEAPRKQEASHSPRSPSPAASASAAASSSTASSSASSPQPVASVAVPVASSSAALVIAIPPDMLGVPGGSFVMGNGGKGEADEKPVHRVKVAPFVLDRTEVTNVAYFRCVAAKACRAQFPGSSESNHYGKDERFRTPNRPISSISQSDAAGYCKWLGRRLPTEAEWERAARGSDGRLFPWGNEPPTHEHAVYGVGVTEDVGTHPKGAGPYGHLDLAGNVWEWVSDYYDPHAYRRETSSQGIVGTCDQILGTLRELKRNHQDGFTGSNPIPDECEHVLRGGAFNYDPYGLRGSNRVHHPGRFRLVMSGFRCAIDWPSGPEENQADSPQNAPGAVSDETKEKHSALGHERKDHKKH